MRKSNIRFAHQEAPAPGPERPRFLRAAETALAAACLMLAAVRATPAQEVLAVLSSGAGAYKESLAGFEKEWGTGVVPVNLSNETVRVPPGTAVVAAFGGKAALMTYPDSAILVYWAAAPDLIQVPHNGVVIEVNILPRCDLLLRRLREIQPGLNDFRVFFVSPDFKECTGDMQKAGPALGVRVRAERLSGAEELPARLRAMNPRPDAIWIAPDPLLINPRSFTTLKDYSWANGVPLYAPSAGLVEQGATAFVGAGFREIGCAAAKAARKALSGDVKQKEVYPEVIETAVNLTAASKTGITFSRDFLKGVQKVYP